MDKDKDKDKAEIIASAIQATFGRPLVNNVLRSILSEAIVDAALGNEWEWCSGDWALCDFRHADGTRLEVKQSAARQNWHSETDKPSAALFDIAPRKLAWDGKKWVPSTGRNAEIYVFAHHPIVGDKADHRDPAQWVFYVVPTTKLPETARISLAGVRARAEPIGCGDLAAAVEVTRMAINSASTLALPQAPLPPDRDIAPEPSAMKNRA